jgi:hypothetical protein
MFIAMAVAAKSIHFGQSLLEPGSGEAGAMSKIQVM